MERCPTKNPQSHPEDCTYRCSIDEAFGGDGGEYPSSCFVERTGAQVRPNYLARSRWQEVVHEKPDDEYAVGLSKGEGSSIKKINPALCSKKVGGTRQYERDTERCKLNLGEVPAERGPLNASKGNKQRQHRDDPGDKAQGNETEGGMTG